MQVLTLFTQSIKKAQEYCLHLAKEQMLARGDSFAGSVAKKCSWYITVLESWTHLLDLHETKKIYRKCCSVDESNSHKKFWQSRRNCVFDILRKIQEQRLSCPEFPIS